ncbi:MAG TPA: peptide ABC transporter substrate-binding protein [Candidatus Dormibacteraeota bacterium]|nr:peptide ABC transporter substrate-binding protein [Candidatus Dormibacteraeota bacterium]
MKYRRIGLALVVPALVATACGSGGTTSSSSGASLAANQQFRFPIVDDIKTLDPGHVSDAVSIAPVQNVFGGLYRFDDQLKEVPYIATGQPDISSDGLTYTFHMRHDVKFSNGDPVTSADVLYSWNRAARLNDSYGIVFAPVVGYSAVAPSSGTPTATTLSGLSAPDQYTVMAKLSSAASYWLTEVALWTMDVVDQKVIPSDTDKTWWTNPTTAIGTGPFKLTAYVPKDHLSFSNVPNWWGGSTGHLTDIEMTVLADQGSQVTKYQNGGFDSVGPADNYPPLDAVRNFQANPNLKSQFVNIPGGRTTWVGFNFTTGPFAPAGGNIDDPIALAGRRAFSEAIDRNQLVNVACGPGGIVCKPATGGVISKGLKSYLGDNADPDVVFNPTKAKQDLATWDPTGTKQKGLVYWFNTSASNTAIAGNLQSQWQTNLGVHVDTQSTDFPTFLTNRQDKKYILFRDSWGADYDNPQDWFDNIFICSQAAIGLGNNDGICDQRVDSAVKKAESESGSQSITDFQTANKQLIKDYAYADLEYGANQYFIKPYVQGGGGNALYDNSWSSISILSH